MSLLRRKVSCALGMLPREYSLCHVAHDAQIVIDHRLPLFPSLKLSLILLESSVSRSQVLNLILKPSARISFLFACLLHGLLLGQRGLPVLMNFLAIARQIEVLELA